MKSNTDVNVTEPASTLTFALGLLAGTFIGAGLMMWIAPRAVAEVRRAVTDSANMFRDEVAGQYDNVSRRATAAIDELASKGMGARDDAADAVARGAREVERIAVSVRAVPPKQL
jgi:hypothetical protein